MASREKSPSPTPEQRQRLLYGFRGVARDHATESPPLKRVKSVEMSPDYSKGLYKLTAPRVEIDDEKVEHALVAFLKRRDKEIMVDVVKGNSIFYVELGMSMMPPPEYRHLCREVAARLKESILAQVMERVHSKRVDPTKFLRLYFNNLANHENLIQCLKKKFDFMEFDIRSAVTSEAKRDKIVTQTVFGNDLQNIKINLKFQISPYGCDRVLLCIICRNHNDWIKHINKVMPEDEYNFCDVLFLAPESKKVIEPRSFDGGFVDEYKCKKDLEYNSECDCTALFKAYVGRGGICLVNTINNDPKKIFEKNKTIIGPLRNGGAATVFTHFDFSKPELVSACLDAHIEKYDAVYPRAPEEGFKNKIEVEE